MPDDAILEMLRQMDGRIATLRTDMNTAHAGLRADLGVVQHDVSMLRAETAETREAVAGLRDHMTRDAVMVQRHMEDAMRMIRSVENVIDGYEDREERAAAFAKGRIAERARWWRWGRLAWHVLSSKGAVALALLLMGAIMGLHWGPVPW